MSHKMQAFAAKLVLKVLEQHAEPIVCNEVPEDETVSDSE